MKDLIFFLLFLVLSPIVQAVKSPHGKGFNVTCEVCHTTDNWEKIKTNGYNHDKTNFPLFGQHKAVDCRRCHMDLNFKNANKECASCHKDVHELTLGRNCERCHTPTTWIVVNIIQIHNQSRFPLIGKHVQIDCYQCHTSPSLLRFDPLRSDCINCHLKDFNATINPSHVSSNFSRDCTLCHNEINWMSTTFNHNATSFPLTGGHSGVECIKCHSNGYTSTPTTCVSCHLTNFSATTNPNHVTAKFSTDCKICHNTLAWSPSTFNHTTATTFPLTGAHIGLACTVCHTNGYGAIPTTCVSCHLTSFNATTNPNHTNSKFPTTCETCHSTTAWVPSTFNHSTTTFPLTGGHIGLSCNVCHTNGYGAIPTTCVSCHLATYNATTNPNHAGANFPTTCETCHTTTNWTSSTFNHTTYFPITSGNHNVSCATCHTNSANYTVFSCVTSACHQTAHNQNQGSAGCYSCHPTGRSGG